MSKTDRLQITELLLVKADWLRTFIATIKRETDDAGQPILRGAVKVDEGVIYSMATDQESLCRNLDLMCVLKLDCDLHGDQGVFIGICDSKYFLN